jgi:hypothetical protein
MQLMEEDERNICWQPILSFHDRFNLEGRLTTQPMMQLRRSRRSCPLTLDLA